MPSSRRSSPPCRRSPATRRRRSRTSATARIAPFATLLERLAAAKPLVLVLDDIHWADSGSVELLGALLHRPPAAAVLLALAVRPRQVPERLAVALERAHRAGTLTRIELGTLTPGEAQELLGVVGNGAAATALYDECGGNPFYLEQLARSLAPAALARGKRPGAVTRRDRGTRERGRRAGRGARAADRRRPPRARRRGRRR